MKIKHKKRSVKNDCNLDFCFSNACTDGRHKPVLFSSFDFRHYVTSLFIKPHSENLKNKTNLIIFDCVQFDLNQNQTKENNKTSK